MGITSVRQPIAEIAQALIDILLGQMSQEPLAEGQVVFALEPIVSRSIQS